MVLVLNDFKKNKKRNFKFISLTIIIFILISIYFFGFDRSKLKVQLHSTNEWIIVLIWDIHH